DARPDRGVRLPDRRGELPDALLRGGIEHLVSASGPVRAGRARGVREVPAAPLGPPPEPHLRARGTEAFPGGRAATVSASHERVTACSCGGSELGPPIRSFRLGETPFALRRCRRCGRMLLDPRPAAEALSSSYDDYYYGAG